MIGQGLDKVYAVLSHSRRRKIIELIGERRYVRPSELRKIIGVSPGTLYYDLDVLKKNGLVAQSEEGYLYLTSLGELAYKFILHEEEILRTITTHTIVPEKLIRLGRVLSKLIPTGFMMVVTNHLRLSLPLLTTYTLLSTYLASVTGIGLRFLAPQIQVPLLHVPLTYFLTLLVMTILLVGLCKLTDVKVSSPRILASIIVTTQAVVLPLTLVPIIYYVLNLISPDLSLLIFLYLQPIVQVIEILFLTAGIYVLTNLRLGLSFVIASVTYILNAVFQSLPPTHI